MADPDAPSDRWPPIQYYRLGLVAVICFVVSAAAFVSAIFLFAYCIPGAVTFGAQSCVFPHWIAAWLILGGGTAILILGVVFGLLAWISLEPERYQELMHPKERGNSTRVQSSPPAAVKPERPT
jgi:hypothetical protein